MGQPSRAWVRRIAWVGRQTFVRGVYFVCRR